MGSTWEEHTLSQMCGRCHYRDQNLLWFPSRERASDLLFLCIRPVWCPSQTAWLLLFPFPAVPLETAHCLGWMFSEGKTRVFVTTFVGWITFTEVCLQQQDFSQICTVWIDMQTRYFSSFPQAKEGTEVFLLSRSRGQPVGYTFPAYETAQ